MYAPITDFLDNEDTPTIPERGKRRRLPRAGLRERPPARPVLMPGDEGQAVWLLQRKLANLGYELGPVDGVYGDQTARAVCAFRAEHPWLRQGVGYTDLLLHAALEDTDLLFSRV